MTKQAFLGTLRERLSGLPREDLEERLSFYSEMIDDRMEEGRTEEQAISDIGTAQEVAAQIIAEIPLSRIAKERMKPARKIRVWEIVLLILGSPIWFSLAVAAFAVVFSLYAAMWSIVVSLWAVFGSLAACAVGGLVTGSAFAFSGNGLPGIAVVAASVVCAGLSIFLFFGCNGATKGMVLLTKKIVFGIKKALVSKEEA